MRHSDPRLTTGPYTDTTRLETASLIEKLPDFVSEKDTDTQLDTQTIGASSPGVAQAVSVNAGDKNENHAANIVESHGLTPAVAVCHSGQSDGVSEFESSSLRQFDY